MRQPINLGESVFPITHPEINKNFGTAFLCHQKGDASYFLTCAHVVETVTKGAEKMPVIDGNKVSKIIYKGSKVEDIALLRVDHFEQRDKTSQLQPLGLLAKTNLKGDFAEAYTWFQEPERWISRKLKLRIENEESHSSLDNTATKVKHYDFYLRDKGNDLEKVVSGNSGSPVIDKETKQIVGIIVQSLKEKNERAARKGRLLSINNLLSIDEISKQIKIEPDKKRNTSEASNTTPGFFHMIDHGQQLNKLQEHDFSENKKLLFALVVAQAVDRPDGFAQHCHIKLSQETNIVDMNFENEITMINLKPIEEIESVLAIKLGMAGNTQSDFNIIEQYLKGRKISIILVQINDDFSRKTTKIIEKAIDSMSKINLFDTKVLVLFVCNKLSPKKLFIFPAKIPDRCLFLGELRLLNINDTGSWINSIRGQILPNEIESFEDNLQEKFEEEPDCSYQTMLKWLREIRLQTS